MPNWQQEQNKKQGKMHKWTGYKCGDGQFEGVTEVEQWFQVGNSRMSERIGKKYVFERDRR